MACSSSIRLGALCRTLLSPQISQTHLCRMLVVLKRKHPVPLVSMDKPVDSRKMKEKHFIYELVKQDYTTPVSDIECVLTRHVDGLGSKGQIVTVQRKLFRKTLMPSGAAVYASPENIAEYENKQLSTEDMRTKHALQTYRLLCGMNLPVRMNPFTSWTLNQSHIQLAFRIVGIYIENLDAIILPEEPITNEHDHKVPFEIKVKINGIDEATVTCYKVPFSSDPKKVDLLPEVTKFPTFTRAEDAKQRLMEEGLYNGTK